jgi:hypothetical protein
VKSNLKTIVLFLHWEIKEEDISIITISSSSSSSESESGDDYEVEKILAERIKHNQTEYLVKFEGIFFL